MANEVKNLIGMKFGRLTVVKYNHKIKGQKYYLCKCDCGNTKLIRESHLKSGATKSCGCYNKEIASKRFATHLKSKTKLYKTWQCMKKRCYNKNDTFYNNYGERGIIVCQKWLDDFMNFYNWAINNGYSNELTIDRIDVNGNYEPSNCRWATKIEQARNTRSNHLITYKGETHCIAEWSEITGITKGALDYRIAKGWNVEKMLTTPVRKW